MKYEDSDVGNKKTTLTSAFRQSVRRSLPLICFIQILSFRSLGQTGTWHALAHPAPDYNMGVMLLLTDGTVMCKTSAGGAYYGTVWDKLTPDGHGSYINGAWTRLSPMDSDRHYFSTQILRDGCVYVAGGEYGGRAGQGGGGGTTCEKYNPKTDTWTELGRLPAQWIGDANSELLPSGAVLQATVIDTELGVAEPSSKTFLFNPIAGTFALGPSTNGIDNESVWVKLPDNSVLFCDRNNEPGLSDQHSERYIPSSNTWVVDATVPVELYDAFGDESGAAFLLPNGTVIFFGSTSTTAIYTPSGNSSPGSWAVGPIIPNGLGAPDAAAAMMNNGKILLTLSPTPFGSYLSTSTDTDIFTTPIYFYEFDYISNIFTEISNMLGSDTIGSTSDIYGTYCTNMLDLPDGNVLFSFQGSDDYWVYSPSGSPIIAGQPTINAVIQNTCDSFTVTGVNFNGISEGAAYGDDWQMSTNYPMIRLTSSGNVFYCTTSNWNKLGAVMTGAALDTAQFTLPIGLPSGSYSLQVIVNGNSSSIISFETGMTPIWSSAGSVCASEGLLLTDATSGGGWSSSNTSVATVGTSGVLTGVNAGTSVISYSLSGCGSTSMTVTVDPLPVAGSITGSTSLSVGSTTILNDDILGGIWSSSNVTIATIGSSGIVTGNASGLSVISYTVSNNCGSANTTATLNISTGYICPDIISTIAGNGTDGTFGDGGPATSCELNYPFGVAIDNDGNIYIADQENNRIRKITTSGVISNFAGNGTAGFSGDQGPATAAELNAPVNLAFDASGNLYIAEFNGYRIRKVSPLGIINTFAGNGSGTFTGNGGQATNTGIGSCDDVNVDNSGNVYIAANNHIYKVNATGLIYSIAGNGTNGYAGDGGQATAAELNGARGVVIDLGENVYIADRTNSRIRKINSSGVITTFAGNGVFGYTGDGGLATAAELRYPWAIRIDGSGNIFFTDGTCIREVNTSGIISTFAGTGTPGYNGDGSPATSREIVPAGIAIDSSYNVYIADDDNQRIRKVTIPILSITGTRSIFNGSLTTLSDLSVGGTWSSSNSTIASIGSTTGIVRGLSVGTSKITYTLRTGCIANADVAVYIPSTIIWYSTTSGGEASNLSNWWSNDNNSGLQPTSFATTNTTWTYQSIMTSSVALTFAGNVSIDSGETFTPPPGSVTTVGGNWTNNGSFVNNGGTVLFNGANGVLNDTLSCSPGGMIGVNGFNNIIFNAPGVSYTFQGNAADVAADFSQLAGTVVAPSSNLNIGGNFSHTGGNFNPNSGTINMTGGSSSIIAIGMNTATTNCFNNLVFNGNSTCIYSISSSLLLMGTFNNLNTLGNISIGNNNISLGGNWNNSGSISVGKCHILMNGTGVHSVTGNM